MASSFPITSRWGLEKLDTPHYYPPFLWRFFLTSIGPKWQNRNRVHIYDAFNDCLLEMRRGPQSRSVFADFIPFDSTLGEECLAAIREAEEAFTTLEATVEVALAALLQQVSSPCSDSTLASHSSSTDSSDSSGAPGSSYRRDINLDSKTEHALRKYLIFLRYRNSPDYQETVLRLGKRARQSHSWMGFIPYGSLRRAAILKSIRTFLEHTVHDDAAYGYDGVPVSEVFEDIEVNCWLPMRQGKSELSVGIASETQEFVNTERAFGNLDGIHSDPSAPSDSSDGSYHLFFPITPMVAVYLVTKSPTLSYMPIRNQSITTSDGFSAGWGGKLEWQDVAMKDARTDRDRVGSISPLKRIRGIDTTDEESQHARKKFKRLLTPSLDTSRSEDTCQSPIFQTQADTVTISCDTESVSDVHLRNAILLRTSPRYILFSSLESIITSITVTPTTSVGSDGTNDTYSSTVSNDMPYLDTSLSKLRTHCRQKHIREGLIKTLVVKGEVAVKDLTDEITLPEMYAAEHGSYSDIWKGEWCERGLGGAGSTKRVVALKVLRQHMKEDVKEKLLSRLKDEILTWHRLNHPHIVQLHGVMRWPKTIAMVAPWCKNGTVVNYVKANPSADRLVLIHQIASGVAYLHNFNPAIIHGDLKGNNILIGDNGQALITDFGLSKIIEDMSESGTGSLASSLHGAIRWLAPEIVRLLKIDDSRVKLTKASDVYAFAAVCMEILTEQLPYPNRRHNFAVMTAKMEPVPMSPADGVPRTLSYNGHEEFWDMMDRCWNVDCESRPHMTELREFFAHFMKLNDGS
ncbi:kinase-like protein [Panus rudis PR-1116 ss-1]|nr:kinase-like protein [Panus rudis PR-1116 ss-1]